MLCNSALFNRVLNLYSLSYRTSKITLFDRSNEPYCPDVVRSFVDQDNQLIVSDGVPNNEITYSENIKTNVGSKFETDQVSIQCTYIAYIF